MRNRERPGARRVAAVWILAMGVAGGWAFAHHGWSEYDAGKTLNLTGVSRESAYGNPHGTIRLQVGGDKGATWLCILAPPSRMTSRGLKDMVKVGATVTVVGYPHKETPEEMRAERITIEGKTVELR